jgi:hypothetical protein
MLRRSRGFDVPDMLAAGPRDVMVPQSGSEAARQVLLQADMVSDEKAAPEDPVRVALWLGGGVALVAAIAYAGTNLFG